MICEKLTFETFAEAETVVHKAAKVGRVKKRRQANKKPKRVYKCEVCGKYHLTSLKKTNKRRIRL